MDEVFGEDNFVSLVSYPTSVGLGSDQLDNVNNYIIWFSKSKEMGKFRPLFRQLVLGEAGATRYSKIKTAQGVQLNTSALSEAELEHIVAAGGSFYTDQGLTSRSGSSTTLFPVSFCGRKFRPKVGGWRTATLGMSRTLKADRILATSGSIRFQKNFDDFGALSYTNNWDDVSGGVQSRNDPKVYVVQTATSIVQRCILMTTDPGDLVLDPTCGSGTTAYVAEQWGRRWITIDTSRVAIALARSRLMGARYP
jgi:adenine-specific DNA-methyltransferase